MSATLALIIECRATSDAPWAVVAADGLLAHRQFLRLALVGVSLPCPVYTLAAPSAMIGLLRGGIYADDESSLGIQQGIGLPPDASPACRRASAAIEANDRGPGGWLAPEYLAADAEPSFEEAVHMASTLRGLGAKDNVRIVFFLV